MKIRHGGEAAGRRTPEEVARFDRLIRGGSALFAVLFLVGAAVQYNDPDPVGWVAVYLAAAIVCILRLRGSRHAWLVASVEAVVCLVWALILVPAVIGQVSLGDLFQEMEPEGGPIEVGRELGGLLIIGVWMTVLAFERFLRPRGRPGAGTGRA